MEIACKFRPSKVVYPEASIRVTSPKVIFLLMLVAVVHFSSWQCCRSHANPARCLTGISAQMETNVVIFVPARDSHRRWP